MVGEDRNIEMDREERYRKQREYDNMIKNGSPANCDVCETVCSVIFMVYCTVLIKIRSLHV